MIAQEKREPKGAEPIRWACNPCDWELYRGGSFVGRVQLVDGLQWYGRSADGCFHVVGPLADCARALAAEVTEAER
jgi:hypothetical protein